ncbi:hypothetical protein [Rhodanobacter lindaniclasticus]
MRPTILLADDQADVREALRLLLKSEGIASVGVDGPAAALEAARQRDFNCALMTSTTPATPPRARRAWPCSMRCASTRRSCRWW